jgi:hypothetical protein
MAVDALLIALAAAILVLAGVGIRTLRTYRSYRGKMLVRCPETRRPVGVDVDARHAALHQREGKPELRLWSCTRWPERADCGQDCLSQVERGPDDCLVRNVLADWYQQRACVFCEKPFGSVDSYDHTALFSYDKKPGLRSPAGVLVEWLDVPVESLLEVLGTHQAVCWDCLLTEQFRRDHPELVVDRTSRTKAG